MVRLRILDILAEQNHTKYWLYKQMDLSYQNFNRMVENQTTSIKFENLDRLSDILDCSVGDLFEKSEDTELTPPISRNLPIINSKKIAFSNKYSKRTGMPETQALRSFFSITHRILPMNCYIIFSSQP